MAACDECRTMIFADDVNECDTCGGLYCNTHTAKGDHDCSNRCETCASIAKYGCGGCGGLYCANHIDFEDHDCGVSPERDAPEHGNKR